ncbi:hypothetical protein H5410_060357 [Solanum commersonii]|uniref:Uncharacterized protein n=1 Tax=Solanum commersonii TaxID=4109 RepID=A0A9J5W5E3_SOLCO|nr:hypothetical protein H5410_060357 [Solanum commersonii]
MAKSDKIIEGYSFRYKEKFVNQYITSTDRELKINYMTTFKSYKDEVNGMILDALKANLKGVIVLTSTVENTKNEYLDDHNPDQPNENYVRVDNKNILCTSNNKKLCECVASLEQTMMKVVTYVRDDKLKKTEKNKKKKDRLIYILLIREEERKKKENEQAVKEEEKKEEENDEEKITSREE